MPADAHPTVVVTGASTGIGRGTAKLFIDRGWRVFGSVRKDADAERLKKELGERFTPLKFDVTDESAVKAAAIEVRSSLGGTALRGLVNNAGMSTGGPLMHQPIDDFRHQIEVNLVGQLIVTQAFVPLLGADRSLKGPPGRVVNISSVGGRIAFPFIGAYAASKHALEGMSESLRRELMLYGIDVIIVGPGAVVTPIWDKAEEFDTAPYAGTDYAQILRRFTEFFIARGRQGLPPERVGEVVFQALTVARPRVRYAVVRRPFLDDVLPRLMPKRRLDRLIAKQLGLAPSTLPATKSAGVPGATQTLLPNR